jgi:hypothetical protein
MRHRSNIEEYKEGDLLFRKHRQWLIIPKKIEHEWRWLEWAEWLESAKEIKSIDIPEWKSEKWLN